MPLWEALGKVALAAWAAHAIGHDNGMKTRRRPEGRTCTAGRCPQCRDVNTDYLEFIDWGRSLRSLGLVRDRRGFYNSCFLNWDDALPHWDGFE